MQRRTDTSRREFLTTAAAIGAPLLVSPRTAFGAQANSRVTLGVLGCGGRGTWIAELLQKHGGYEIRAAADYFQDRVDNVGTKLQVAPERRYTGLDGYKKVLAGDVDAVAIESPPYFHPIQAREAVEAGKHVYLAKPVAVDVPGCRTVEESGRRATEKQKCFLVDFQTRTDPLYREAVKRAGARPEQIERAIIGNVLSAGMGQAPARQAVIKAGLPVSTGAVTVNKVCGSGLQAVMYARREILIGDAEVLVAGGMESMTNAP